MANRLPNLHNEQQQRVYELRVASNSKLFRYMYLQSFTNGSHSFNVHHPTHGTQQKG